MNKAHVVRDRATGKLYAGTFHGLIDWADPLLDHPLRPIVYGIGNDPINDKAWAENTLEFLAHKGFDVELVPYEH